MIEKAGMERNVMANVFRRIGMDDITINNVFKMVDEQKISVETGRLYNAEIDFS
jgi:ribulose 1,5-bisphosphate carboxylase large subunit-like protein